MKTLIGPFTQLLTMDHLAESGHLPDDALEIIPNAGVLVQNGTIIAIDSFKTLQKQSHTLQEIPCATVAMPGFIDAHTHICFAGSRATDYSLRLKGLTYQEIAAQGGGILNSVKKTRQASQTELETLLFERTQRLLELGVTTCEVKSGYGLTLDDEIKMLTAIRNVSNAQPVTLIPTCLAAHIVPPEFDQAAKYLNYLETILFPILKQKQLTKRIDIFIDSTAFSVKDARPYLKSAQQQGFSICLHADQFSRGGVLLAAELQSLSADHLEVSNEEDFAHLKRSGVIPIILPGASLGLGIPFGPARAILDHGLPLVLASDWNPGSAPMGHLLLQASLIGIAERLSTAETLAAITVRAAKALELKDRGVLKVGMQADIIAFPCAHFHEILYHQGSMLPYKTIIKGSCQE